MKKVFFLITACAAILVIQCSDSPQLMFPEDQEVAQVTGYISPRGVVAVVYILDAAIVDSVKTDSTTGYFRFDSIPYGSYQVKVVAAGYGILTETVYISASFVNMYTLRLKTHPSQINTISPPNNTIINAKNSSLFTDTTAVIRIIFKEKMDTASISSALTVTPLIPWSIQKTEYTDPYHYIYLALPIIDFFSYPQVTLLFDQSAQTIYGEHLDFDFTLTYYPDTSSLADVITSSYIIGTEPSIGISDVDATTDIKIQFRRPMQRISVENAFSILPSATPNFFWENSTSGYESLIIKFPQPLQNSTRYTVTLDTGMVTLDSTVIPGSMEFYFTTRSMEFTGYTPLNGVTSFPATKPFTYITNFYIDTASFLKAFSIIPAVDSLSLSCTHSSDGYDTVTVYHSLLKLNTPYLIHIDSTLKSISGTLFGDNLTHQFTTESVLSDTTTQIDSSFIVSVYPPDTTNLTNCSSNPVIYFKHSMHKQSVEQRISLVPATLFILQWDEYLSEKDRKLTIDPSQRLKANTTYTAVLDSGSQTVAGKTGDRYTFSFKTLPITLVEYKPLNGQINVPTSARIELKFNTALDTTALLPNITLTPAVDSLHISATSVSNSTSLYYLDHAGFLPESVYTLTLQSGIADQFGVLLGRSYSISFTTGK